MKEQVVNLDTCREFVVKMSEYLPLDSYFTVFEHIFKQPVPHVYVADLAGIGTAEETLLGVLVLMKRHALDCGVKLQLRNANNPTVMNEVNRFLAVISDKVA